ncbi:asparaginase [Lactarius akahatsu]|uniref:Asparaginase n=1 Tax=Lactarius akahatsu TaxID=416441 RepID=A0AAD4Q7L1_9AGAM|nr:asparaginase [Lactarius akahatsu]
MSEAPFYFIAIHGGAGYHPPSSDSSIRRSLRTAVSSALTTLTTVDSNESGSGSRRPGTSPTALDTTTALVAALEDSLEFNAGYGSNLTFDGDVECDAALMDGGCCAFGGVGAVRCVRNPVLLARCVLDARRQQQPRLGLGLGRVPPLLLVGEGAVRFAAERGGRAGAVEEPAEMVTPRARREWEVWRERWEDEERRTSGPSDGLGAPDLTMLRARQDTVGAVVVQGDAGDVAAGVSSGGLLLKPSGRVGEAAVFGAGCWAERLSDGRSIACSVSGQGELIVQSSMAKTLAERIAAAEGDTHDVLRSVLVDHFYSKWHLRGEHQPAVGVLLLTRGMDGDESTTRLWCAFTTQSMAVAYSSSQHPKPKALVLRNTTHDFSNEDARPPLFITTLSF